MMVNKIKKFESFYLTDKYESINIVKIFENYNKEVTSENYALAETQVIFKDYIDRIKKETKTNGIGVFIHNKDIIDPNDKTIVRVNFDTLYSYVVLDLKSDATLIMPETSGRYQSAWVITEEHYNPMAFTEKGEYKITENDTKSRYIMILVRTEVNISDPKDIKVVNKLQDELIIEQKSNGSYDINNDWDMDSILEMRKHYQDLVEEKGIKTEDMFGEEGKVSLENHNCGVAYGWGGLTSEQAIYIPYTPTNIKPCTFKLDDVPVDAFWSVTIYDIDGYPKSDGIYTINNSFAKSDKDGTIIINFGGDEDSDNYMDIFKGWNFVLRLYLPTKEYFDGKWKEPKLVYKPTP